MLHYIGYTEAQNIVALSAKKKASYIFEVSDLLGLSPTSFNLRTEPWMAAFTEVKVSTSSATNTSPVRCLLTKTGYCEQTWTLAVVKHRFRVTEWNNSKVSKWALHIAGHWWCRGESDNGTERSKTLGRWQWFRSTGTGASVGWEKYDVRTDEV